MLRCFANIICQGQVFYIHFLIFIKNHAGIIFPFQRCRNWGSERLSNRCKTTALVKGRDGSRILLFGSKPHGLPIILEWPQKHWLLTKPQAPIQDGLGMTEEVWETVPPPKQRNYKLSERFFKNEGQNMIFNNESVPREDVTDK